MILGFNRRFEKPILKGDKVHTIREDRKNRHSGGGRLHLSIGVRTKAYRCLKETLCTGVQQIEILYGNGGYCDVFVYQDARVLVDGRELSYPEVTELAKNDGFDSQDAFFKWFSSDFKGKIIHWTNLKY
jgi:uncharacterized protein YqfB (UPF0267 family)